MTPKQSRTRKQSLIRRSLAVLSAALLATAWTIGISTPASAAGQGLAGHRVHYRYGVGVGAPVQGRPFNVVVRVLDSRRGTIDS